MEANNQTAEFFRIIKSPPKFRLFMLRRLPAAFFSGLKIESIDEESCTVSIPYGWFTQNPFRSTYFACLSMAAEMSTGALALANVYKRMPAVSTLITAVESTYHKKAIGRTFFTCIDGVLIKEAIAASVQTNTSQTIKAYSKGVNAAGETIAEFWFTWSFKAKVKI
jgi:hypothetical protein